MDNEALLLAGKILDEISRKGFRFGNKQILKNVYQSLRLNLNGEYTDSPIGAYFILADGVKKYAYVIGTKDKIPVGHKMTNVPIVENEKIMFSFYSDDDMKLAWIDAKSDSVTIEDVMLEMKNIIADSIKVINANCDTTHELEEL